MNLIITGAFFSLFEGIYVGVFEITLSYQSKFSLYSFILLIREI